MLRLFTGNEPGTYIWRYVPDLVNGGFWWITQTREGYFWEEFTKRWGKPELLRMKAKDPQASNETIFKRQLCL